MLKGATSVLKGDHKHAQVIMGLAIKAMGLAVKTHTDAATVAKKLRDIELEREHRQFTSSRGIQTLLIRRLLEVLLCGPPPYSSAL